MAKPEQLKSRPLSRLALFFGFLLFLACPLAFGLDYRLLASYEIKVQEPSGLAYDPERGVLLVVSDEGGFFALTKKAQIVESHSSPRGDLEGIAYDPARGLIYIAEERERRIFVLNRRGEVLRSFRIDLAGYNRPDNEGIESLTLDTRRGHLFLVKERNPFFVMELDREGNPLRTFKVEGISNLSGIHYVERTGHFLLLSRGSQKVLEVNREGKLVGEPFSIGFPNAEGITLDERGYLYLSLDGNNLLPDRLLIFAPRKPH